ncbi:MAG: hypothetical protein ACI4II_07190 [Acutalibacteraceae bacterium]
MNSKRRIFACIISVLTFMYISCYTTFANAVDTIGEPDTDPIISSDVSVEPIPSEEPSSEDPIPSDEPSSEDPIPSDEPSSEDPIFSDEPSSEEPPIDEPTSSEDPYESIPDTSNDPVQNNNESSESQPEYVIPGNDDNNYYDPGYSYQGDPVASLYDVSTVIDTNELDADDWNIVLNFDTSSIGNANMGLKDFNFIKNNTGDGSDEDDSQWILYTGYVLLALGIIGILYVIISTIYRIKHKDKYDKILKERKQEKKTNKKSSSGLKAGHYS